MLCTEAWAIDVASQTDWTNAVAAVAAAGAGTTVSINITGGFTLTSSLAQIQAGNANVTVNVTGNNQTINGANTYQGIQVSGANAPNVNISSLAITNTAAFGGSGQNGQNGYYSGSLSYGSGGGGGGGLGAGGGLYVGGGANVTVASVTFTGTSATGGAGGSGGAAQNAASSGTGGNGGAGGAANNGGVAGGGGTGGSGGNTGVQGTAGAAGVALGAGGGGGGGSGTTSSASYTGNNSGGVGSNAGGHGGAGGDGVTNNNGSQGPGADGGFGGSGGAAQGGAVYVATGGTLTILDTAISGASVAGGALGAAGTGQGPNAFNGSAGSTGAAAGSGIYLNGVQANIGVSTGMVTYANTIAGAGLTTAGVTTTLNKTGAGTLVLSGANSFTGNVNISGGAVSVASSGNLGSGSKSLVLSEGATFAVTATGTFGATIGYKISGVSSFDIASGATGTFMGAVSNGASTGNLVKTDAGVLVLSGTNTYTGSTTVSGGTLRAGSAGAFGTSGVFSVAAGATLDLNAFNRTFSALSGAGSVIGGATTISGTGTLTPGNATAASSMVIGGNLGFQSGAQYVVQVNPTIASFAAVTGTATLTGASVQAVYSAGSYLGATYTILHTGGLGGTTFASLDATGLPSGFTETLSYTATDVQLTLSASAATTIATAGTTYNASNLGAIVSPAFTGGTLVMDQSGTYSQNFTLNNSGTNTIDQHGAASIFSGALTDATTGGGIIIANAGSGGSVTFSGQNTYTGSTAVNAGATLMLSGQGSIAASSRLVANGVFDISGVASGASVTTLAGGGSVVLGNRTLTLTNANDTFAGSITGSGGLTIAGGTETLTGASTFASTIINSGGALIVNGSITDPTVNSGGTLSGVGSVGATNVNAGGTLAPGSGVAGTSLTVNGNLAFQAGAIYQVQVNPTAASFTTVAGAATLGGATVSAIFANGSYISKVYPILTASGGVSGTFAPAVVNTNLPANFNTTLTYDADNAYLNLNLNFFSTPAAATLNSNQRNVATALTNSFNTAGGIPLAFGAMSAAQLTAIDGEAATGADRGAFDMMNQFLALMVDPFADGRNPAAFGQAAFETASTPPHGAEAALTQNWSAWSAGFGGLNRANGDAAQGSTAIIARDYGYAAGLDYRLAPNTVVGFAFAGGGVNWGLAQGLGAGSGTSFQAGVYGATHFNSVYVSADFAFANHWLKTDRSALGDQLSAKFDAQDFGGRIEAGYRFNLPTPEAIAVTPYAALQMQKYSAPSYSEADPGAGGFGLNYSATNAMDVRTELGSRLDAPTSLDGMPFMLRGRLAWAHDSIGSPALNATLQSLPGASFTVHGAPVPRDTALASVGAELRVANGWLVSAKFDGEFAKGSQTFAGSAAIRYTW